MPLSARNYSIGQPRGGFRSLLKVGFVGMTVYLLVKGFAR